MLQSTEGLPEVFEQPDPRFVLSVRQSIAGWVYHLDFASLPRKGGRLIYEQIAGQTRDFAISQGLKEARQQLARQSF